jgi:cyanate permease
MILANKISSRWYYGWVMVWLSGIIFFFSAPGQTYSISVFIDTAPGGLIPSQTIVSGVYSAATVFMVLGSALGPLPFGISYDLTGDYTAVLIAMIVYVFVILMITFKLRPPTSKA